MSTDQDSDQLTLQLALQQIFQQGANHTSDILDPSVFERTSETSVDIEKLLDKSIFQNVDHTANASYVPSLLPQSHDAYDENPDTISEVEEGGDLRIDGYHQDMGKWKTVFGTNFVMEDFIDEQHRRPTRKRVYSKPPSAPFVPSIRFTFCMIRACHHINIFSLT